MFRGECPVGVVKVAGLRTRKAQFCVIIGGKYKPAGSADQERETCTFKNGRVYDVRDYFAGRCSRSPEAEQSLHSDPFAYCAAVGPIDRPDGRYVL